MVRQYIGARYVTKIYENSLDPSSAEWEAGVTYEPLTMVTYNNSSYLSKKEVPGAIGDPASNPSYWAVTGAFNGQILALQNQINSILALLHGQDFTSRKFAFASDSWLGVIENYLVPLMGLSITDVIRISCSGGGFVQQNGDGDTFITKLQAKPVDDDVTDFLIIGGQNDAYGGQSASDVETALNTYFALARTKYPNATLYFVPCQHITDTFAHAVAYTQTLMPVFQGCCAANAVKYYPNAAAILNKLSLVSGDRQHASADGSALLSKYLLNVLIGGDISVQSIEEVTITTSTINTIVDSYIKTDNNFTKLTVGIGNTAGAFEFLTTKTVADLINVRTTLANIAEVGGNIVNSWDFREFAPVLVVTTTDKHMTSALFELRQGGNITMQLYPDMSAYGTETIQYIQIAKPLDLHGITYYLA